MKKILSMLLAVCLLAALAVPVSAAQKVDLGTMAEDAINELAKYNTTEVGKPFNVKTMMGYVFATMTKEERDSQYFVPDASGRYEWYKIPSAVLETEMLASFSNGQAAISEMATMEIVDFTFEYGGKVADQKLKVLQAGQYFFNNYNLDRTSIGKLGGKELWRYSKTGFVAVEDIHTYEPLYTVNGYKKAGNYQYDVYATHKDGSIVKFAIEWGGRNIKFLSTAAAASVPGGLTAPGTKAELAITTTAKPTTTTTTKKPATTTTTTTTKQPIGTTTTTTTTAAASGDTTTTAGDVTTTTLPSDSDVGQGDVQPTPDQSVDTNEGNGEDNSNLYLIIGIVLGVVVLGVIAAVVIVMLKMKKK